MWWVVGASVWWGCGFVVGCGVMVVPALLFVGVWVCRGWLLAGSLGVVSGGPVFFVFRGS